MKQIEAVLVYKFDCPYCRNIDCLRIDEFLYLHKEKQKEFIDYICPVCKHTVRIFKGEN